MDYKYAYYHLFETITKILEDLHKAQIEAYTICQGDENEKKEEKESSCK